MRVHEIFCSFQCEGMLAGTPMVFVRFSGCNMKCSLASRGFDCDTNNSKGTEMTITDVLLEVDRHMEEEPTLRWCCLTGGEPLLQVDQYLTGALEARGLYIALETNGTWQVGAKRWRGSFSHVAVGMKVGTDVSAIRPDEVRIVITGDPAWDEHWKTDPSVKMAEKKGARVFLSPRFDGLALNQKAAIATARMLQERPTWHLSMQLHKLLGMQ